MTNFTFCKAKNFAVFFPKTMSFLLVVLLSITTSWVSAQTATITTDQADYPPGSTVLISGSGFTAYETVTLQILHQGTTYDVTAEAHQPWDVYADESGNVFSTWVVPQDALGATLLLTADGKVSGLHSEHLFTDANPIPLSITSLGTSYTENFNTLASSGTANTVIPNGWGFIETGSNGNTTYAASTGSDNAGNTYSFGASANSDRALGGIQSGTVAPILGATFTNNTGSTITSITISYTGEQWRLGATNRVDQLDFQYSLTTSTLSGGSWTDVNALDFIAPVQTGTVGPLNGNVSPNKTSISFTINGLNIANGTSFWIRWNDLDASNADDGLAIDDFSITANGTVQPACSQPILSASASNVSCFGETNGAINLTVTAPVGGSLGTLSYVWKNNTTQISTNEDVLNLAAGSLYNVTVTNSGTACTSSSATLSNIIVSEPTLLVPSETHTNVNCNTGTNGSVTLSASGGTSPYSYTGPGTPSSPGVFTGLAAGVYTYTVTDVNNCGKTIKVTVTEPVVLSLTESHSAILCKGGTSSVTISATGGVSPYTGANVFTQSAGTQTYIVTDANGCSKSISVTIAEPSEISISEVIANVSCNGGNNGSVNLSVGGGSPTNPGGTVTYTQNFNSLVNNGSSSTLPAGWFLAETGSNANTTYSAGTGSDNAGNTYSFGSSGSSDRALGTLLSGSLVSTVGAGSLFVNNTGNTVKSLNISYTGEQWRLGAINRPDKLDFQYSTNATSLNTGDWIDFDVLDFTAPVTTGTAGSALDGNAAGNRTILTATITNLSIPVNGTFWLKWLDQDASGADDGLGIDDFSMTMNSISSPYTYIWKKQSNTITTTEDISNLTAGTYDVTVTDANGCIATKSIEITQSNAIAFTTIATQPKCAGEKGSVTLSTPTGGTGAITFSNTSTTNLSEGDYTYTATDANGCTHAETIHINAAPSAIIATAIVTQPKCFDENGTVIVSATGGTGNYTGTGTFSVPAGGSYSYTVTDEYNCSSNTISGSIDAPTAVVAAATINAPKCAGDNGSVSISASGGTGNYTGTGTFIVAAGDSYSFTVKDANDCSSNIISGTMPAAPVAINFIATPNQPKCSGDKGSVTLSTPTGGTGNITFDGTATTNLNAGDYTYTATDENGCTHSETIHIDAAPSAISFTATANQPKCFGDKGSVTLSSPTGGTGLITFDATPTTNLSAGTYTYTATDANGCTHTESVVINTAPAAISFIATATQPKCYGDKGSVTLSNLNGGTGTVSFDNTPTTNLSEGDYTYTATDENGCTTAHTIHINAAPAAVVATASVTQPKCYGESGTVTVSATGGNGSYSGTGTFTVPAGSSYSYTVIDGNNCSSNTVSGTINAPTQVVATATVTQPKCFGESGTVVVSATGGTGSYTGTGTFLVAAGGSYSYTVKDGNDCISNVVSGTITAPTQVVATAIVTQPKCYGENGTVVVSATGGTGSYTGTGTFAVPAGSSYSYSVIDGNNCSSNTVSGTINAPSQVIATAIVTQPKCYGENGTVVISATGGTGSYTGTGTFSVPAGSSYSYTVKDGNNCLSNVISGAMNAPAAVVASATIIAPKCAGGSGSVTIAATGGNGTYTGTGTFTVAAGATYSYTVTDGNSCSSNTISGTMPAAPAAINFTASATQPKCYGDKGSVTLSTPTGGTGLITFNATATTNLPAGTYVYTATDANGCTASRTVIINAAPAQLVASCKTNTTDNTSYFGYTGDQTQTITVTPTGGTAPYTVQLTLSRSLKCNQVNDAGDEIWSVTGGTTTGGGCPVYPSTAGSIPVSTKTGITLGGNYATTVTLMENAYIVATITDANGCVTTCSTYVHADDVRCFAGNSGNAKVTLCHKTGSAKNPCVTICVDNDAVNEHLAHGDFLGKCTPNCVAPATKPVTPVVIPTFASELTVKVMPNPTPNYFNVSIVGKNNNPVTLRVLDIYGRTLMIDQKIGAISTIKMGEKWTGGTYFVEVMQDNERKVVKVIKAN